jgi:hypothetical protein
MGQYWNRTAARGIADWLWTNLKGNPEGLLLVAAGCALLLRRKPHGAGTRQAPPTEAGDSAVASGKAAKVLLEARQKALEDIRAGRPAPYYFGAPQSSIPADDTARSTDDDADSVARRASTRG